MQILYIEDDATSRSVLRHMLATAGVPMTEAADARSGLALVAERAFDLVIMDLRMPEISGLTAIRQLRAREASGVRVPIVVMSAELGDGARALCSAAGADGFVEKPVTMDRLFRVIGAALSSSEGMLLN